MFSLLFLVVSTLFSFGSALPQDLQSVLGSPDPECTTGNGIHMIVIRATTEKPGDGALIRVVEEVNKWLPGSTNESIVYPAAGIDFWHVPFTNKTRPIPNLPVYTKSETIGNKNTTKAIQEYSQSCPGRKIALLGYSQVRILMPHKWLDRPFR